MAALRRCSTPQTYRESGIVNTLELANLFRRDLRRLQHQLEAIPGEDLLWRTLPGITNSAGTLALHLEGNLREYIGRVLGGLPYIRARELEFSTCGLPAADLLARIKPLQQAIPGVVEQLSPEDLAREYPLLVLERPLSTETFLIHLYGHLNRHLGQIEYLRRVLTGHGALPGVGL